MLEATFSVLLKAVGPLFVDRLLTSAGGILRTPSPIPELLPGLTGSNIW
ncbi:MAG: hypothetical protein JAZ03_11020 [Candidatus Thiodiazotropha taylori]|nr:hypothetical protein [Candidatus Thiodiazotropha taylori]MCW4334458.1 hypothetical protein [Candidatus Thiodiazotropha endolucinida]